MSELENRIDSLLNGKKNHRWYSPVWTDKGDMLRYNDHVHFPLLSVFKFHVALAVLDKMDKQSISLDSIVSKGIPTRPIPTAPAEEVSTRISRLRRN